MKGKREKYDDLREDETFFEFFERHTNKENYSAYSTAYSHFHNFLEKENIEVTEVGDKEAEKFCEYLQEERVKKNHLSEKIAHQYVRYLATIFKWFIRNTDYVDWEPFSDIQQEGYFEFDDRDTKKRDIPLNELRELIWTIENPSIFTIFILMLKTGLRVQEAVNLELEDINLDHPINYRMPRPRSEIANLSDTLYVDSSKSGNKENSYREVPIDEELKRVLAWHIAITPPATDSSNPLFVDLMTMDTAYTQLTVSTIANHWHDWIGDTEYYIEPQHELNLHPHWCRHWFTTVLRANIDNDDVLLGSPEDYVGGLRGDTGDSIIDTYSHNWESLREENDPSWREIYLDAMPSFLEKTEGMDQEKEHEWSSLKEVVDPHFKEVTH